MRCETSIATEPTGRTSVEDLLRIGRLIRFLVRHGAEPTEATAELGIGRKVGELALAFAAASDQLKFRALVEEWTLLALRHQIEPSPTHTQRTSEHAGLPPWKGRPPHTQSRGTRQPSSSASGDSAAGTSL